MQGKVANYDILAFLAYSEITVYEYYLKVSLDDFRLNFPFS